jgi:hypothetical protein
MAEDSVHDGIIDPNGVHDVEIVQPCPPEEPRFKEKPPLPSTSGFHPLYELCHRCELWFDCGDWYYSVLWGRGGLVPEHGNYNRGSSHTASAKSHTFPYGSRTGWATILDSRARLAGNPEDSRLFGGR